MILGLIPAIVSTPVVHAQTDQSTCLRENLHGSPMCVFLHPGIADAWKPGWSHTLDTLWNATNGDPGQKQQVFDKYLDYSILASSSDSIGDLQFDFTILTSDVTAIRIYVPTEFKWLGPTKKESVWTDITNDYEFIGVSTASSYDSVAPNWVYVTIGADNGFNVGFGNIPPATYHVRLFDLRAPEAAGLYHFKIYVSTDGGYTFHSIGAGNFPFTIVKTELNPAWAEVVVRTNNAPARPFVSGEVTADGTTPEGRSVKGVAYWGPMEFIGNSTVAGNVGAMYRVYLFGLAAGTYTITAEASGFNPTTTDRLTLDAGQSYHLFIVLNDSPDVCVTVWSKHGTGAIPWNNLWQLPYGTNNPDLAPNDTAPWRDILLELYDANNNLIGFWASNVFGKDYATGLPRQSPAAFHLIGATKSVPISNRLVGIHDEEAPHPTKTSYYACLVDNNDVLYGGVYVSRGYPSTHWDGHVPWNTADYIAGWPNAQYTVEAYVTGYIMDQADAYQRTFTLGGSNINLQFDLRRSNWIETSMHLPANTFLSWLTTVTLTAEDAAGSERAAIAFTANNTMSLDGVLDGADASLYYNAKWDKSNTVLHSYKGGIVIEGWNAVFPNIYGAASRDIKLKDYGLNPTASTHSSGAVSLAGNPYTIKLYMADMGIPAHPKVNSAGFPVWNATGWYNIVGGDPQVSVFLCNTPVQLSFSIVNAWVWISIRSVDFEVPAHSRPWIFPMSEIWVDFTDTAGNVVDTLDPSIYGLVQDPGMWITTVPNPASGHYSANHDVGWQIKGVDYSATSSPWATGLGGAYATAWPFGITPYDIDYQNNAGLHEHVGVYYFGTDYCSPVPHASDLDGGKPIYRALYDSRSTRLPAGEYSYDVHTHGYVMRRSFPVQIPFAGWADIEADLIEGGQIRVCMSFLHEGVPTEFNGWVRVEVFNSNGDLVGASIYGQAEPNLYKRETLPAGYGTYLAYDASSDNKVAPGPAQGAGTGNFGGEYPYPSGGRGQRAYVANQFYNVPDDTWAFWPNHSSIANRINEPDALTFVWECFDVYGFYQYYGGAARTWAGGWPTTDGVGQSDSGLKGSVDIPGWSGSGAGLYSVKVWAFDPMGPNDKFEHSGATDDWRMYSMAWELKDIQVPWEGAAQVYVDMNDMASLRGTVRWFDMFGNLRPLPWAQVTATNPDTVAYSTGVGAVGSGSSDSAGAYLMWVPAGSHDVSISTSEAPGVWSSAAPTQNAEFTVVVSDGWVGGGDAQLSGSGTPVPEVPSLALPLAMFAVIGASLWLLRKKNLNAPLLMK